MYLLLFIVYLGVVGYLVGGLIQRWFGLSKFLAWWAGIATTLFVLSTLGSIFLVLWAYRPWEVWVVAGIWGFVVLASSARTARTERTDLRSHPELVSGSTTKGNGSRVKPGMTNGLILCGFVVWLLLAVTWLVLLWSARTGELQLSPWVSVSKIAWYVFFLLTVLTVGALFTRLSRGFLLGLIIVYSLLLHSYLPIVYRDGFGGDRWRHVAAERWLEDGKVYSPSLFGEEPRRWSTLGHLKIPTVLVVGNKTSYAPQWFWTLMWHEVTGLDVFWVDIWFLPIFWSLTVPLLLYALAGLLYQERTPRLLAAIAGSFFYPLQVYGAITLPNGFGFIPFLVGVYAWARWQEQNDRRFLALALGITLAMYFGYVLYFILLILFGLVLWLKNKMPRWKFLWFGLLAFSLPLAELFQGTSHISRAQLVRAPSLIKEAILRLTALKPTVPLTGFLDQGNFLYNQTAGPIVGSAFLPSRLAVFATAVIGILTIVGIIYTYNSRRSASRLLALGGAALFINFFISWSLLDGVHVLARRLDLSLATLLALFMVGGIWWMLKMLTRRRAYLSGFVLITLGLSYFGVSTYASGPRLQMVNHDEIAAMRWLVSAERGNPFMSRPCVLADTWPLLALEGESRRMIVAGGFPLYDPDYAQPERVQLFFNINTYPARRYLELAKQITGAKHCYFMTEPRFLRFSDKERGRQVVLKALGEPLISFGDVWIWRFE